MSQRNNILMLAKAFPPAAGGVETYSESVARAYCAQGYYVYVLTQSPCAAGTHVRHYEEGEITVQNVGAGFQFIILLRFLRALRALFRQHKFSFIHATTWRPTLALWPWLKNNKLVITIHGREILINPWYLRLLMPHMFRYADAVPCVSDFTLGIAKSIFPNIYDARRWFRNFNGLSYPDIAQQYQRTAHEEETVRILTIARLVERKNIQGCLRALSLLRDEGRNNFHYKIAGKGPLLGELKSLSLQLGLAEHVTFIGYVAESQLCELYKEADIFLHPQTASAKGADIEGFGLVIADAMSFGNAVIVGNHGGPADFVINNKNGLVVKNSKPEEIFHMLKTLFRSPEHIRRLGADARIWSLQNLSWKKHTYKIYSRLKANQGLSK